MDNFFLRVVVIILSDPHQAYLTLLRVCINWGLFFSTFFRLPDPVQVNGKPRPRLRTFLGGFGLKVRLVGNLAVRS